MLHELKQRIDTLRNSQDSRVVELLGYLSRAERAEANGDLESARNLANRAMRI